ncbi:MAG: asparagine synthetase B [Desulfobacteraceae bacterium]|nr:asparagine synthetase B [Desulfobacteraceae bacterium]
MCGIAGIYTGDRDNLLERARSALQLVKARGPDSQRIVFSGLDGDAKGYFGALAVARLAMVDVNGPPHPLESEDGRFRVALNGELWNFRQLRARLESEGVRFRTGCDAEVVLHAVSLYGSGAPGMFRGQFAYVVEDRALGILHAGRDPHGICPFFHGRNDRGEFVFGSTVRVLLENNIRPSGVRVLPQGYCLEYRLTSGELRFHRYHDIEKDLTSCGPADDISPLRELLFEAVLDKVPDEVEYATIAGGIDSSLATAICASGTKRPLCMITVATTEDRDSSDVRNARLMSERLGIRSIVGIVDEDYIRANVERVILCLGSANYLAVLAAVAGLKAAEMAAEAGAKAIITGGGADEIFGGYEFVWNMFETDRVERNLLHVYLQSGVFECHREDAVTASVGVEARPAYYDTRLARMVLGAAPAERISGLGTGNVTEKVLLKRLAKGLIPESIIELKKSPLYRSTSMTQLFEKAAGRMIGKAEAEAWRAQAIQECPSWRYSLAMPFRGPVLIHRIFSRLFPGVERLPLPWTPPDYGDPDSYGRFHGGFGSPCLEGFRGMNRVPLRGI